MGQQQEFQADRRKRLDDLPELPEGRPMLLLSAVYSGEEKKVYLKFYDPKDNVIYLWRDRTDHRPYCYTKMEFADQAEQVAQKETKYTLERVKKRDIISDKEIDVLKVLAPDPLSIGGTDSSFREKVTSWECYDKETEMLTRDGWKRYYQLHDDENIATYNSSKHKFEWQQIQAKVEYDYDGEMYGLHSKTIDFLVTPNHKIFLWNEETAVVKSMLAKQLFTRYSNLQAAPARDYAFPSGYFVNKTAEAGFDGGDRIDRFVLSQSSPRCGKKSIPIEEFMEFLGRFIADGGLNGDTYIEMILSTSRDPWQRLKDMIKSWGIKVWSGTDEGSHTTKLVFSAKDLAQWLSTSCYTGSIHRAHYKRVPVFVKNLPTKHLKIFLQSLFLGDGTIRHGKGGQLKTTSEALADDIQEIACKCGYSATIKLKPAIVDNRGLMFADYYVVTLSSHRTRTNPAERITKEHYVGKVWCVKVPNGIIYVRRNKKPYWCGNSDIKYHENYLYDRSLIPGLYYVRKDEQITLFEYPISEKVQSALKSLLWDKIKEAGESGKEYRQYITNWANLLNQPVPELKRVAVDIEVESEEGRMPNPRDHDRRVTAVGFVGSDGFRKVLVLANNTPNTGEPLIPEAEPCGTEKELLEKAFRIVNEYPIIITFNGDDFDLPYLYARSQDPRIDPKGVAVPKEKVPIMVKKESSIKRGMQAEPVGIRHGIHIDLYRTFDNRSIQIYAFSRAYTEHTLNAICEALLNDTKVEFEGDISDLPIQKLAEYCLKDADLTYRLTSFNDSLLMRLLVVIARIGRLSVDDIARFGVNQWIRGILYYEHRQRNELIPSRSELEAKGSASTTAVIKEKKYRGGEVVEPVPGIHFGVVVLDFASLYPSIIKVHNLSYETINCPHDDCRETKIEGTTHWVCRHRKGLASLLIGSLRDLRVNYYKHLAKDKTLPQQERQLYNVVSQAIKVILNASYGVMGAEIFPLYCLPVADATAALGRSTINRTIAKCKEIGIQVVYGDTDSIFLSNPDPKRVEELMHWARETLGVDLEIDKQYRYVVFSELKKNYLGVLADGTVDVKGLTGKKSHTPPFIRKAFYDILAILGKVNSEKDFESARESIKNVILEDAKNLEARKIPLEDLSFNVTINKSLSAYGKKTGAKTMDGKNTDTFKGLPQHIKAAKMLVDANKRDIRAGDVISYVKIKMGDGVKPVELAKPEEIDTEKYLETMEATLDQVLSALNFDFKSVLGKPRQQSLDELFWSKPAS
ncbi:MAG TPA: DNA-directed DNA polymerase I [Nitrososphaera sp.]